MKKHIQTREERMAEEYWEAFTQYGKEEAVHVVAEIWGYSLYRAEQEIQKIEEKSWL